MLTAVAALICIVLGFVAAIADVKILFEPIVWFVAAIAFNTLTVPSFALTRREG
jgi:hypothetical protein